MQKMFPLSKKPKKVIKYFNFDWVILIVAGYIELNSFAINELRSVFIYEL